jgi:peptidoglycan hydrolase CwlO-like protein
LEERLETEKMNFSLFRRLDELSDSLINAEEAIQYYDYQQEQHAIQSLESTLLSHQQRIQSLNDQIEAAQTKLKIKKENLMETENKQVETMNNLRELENEQKKNQKSFDCWRGTLFLK